MTIAMAEMLVTALAAYAGIGALVALFTVTAGARRFDEQAVGMPIQARFLVFWGAAGLWPYVLWLLIRGRREA